jgi:hypothetical protein
MSRCRSPSRKWRSPKEVLYIREDKDSRRRHDPSKPLMSACDSLTQENIELKALVEILKAKNKADSSKHLALAIKAQEVRPMYVCMYVHTHTHTRNTLFVCLLPLRHSVPLFSFIHESYWPYSSLVCYNLNSKKLKSKRITS